MNRKSIYMAAAAVVLSTTSAIADPTITYRDILSGAYGGDLEAFTVNRADGDLLKKRGLHVMHRDNGGDLVSKLADPQYQECWKNIGTPIVLKTLAIGAGVLGSGIASGIGIIGTPAPYSVVERAQACQRDWLSRVHEATQDAQLDVLGARIGELDPIVSGAVADILNLQNRSKELEVWVTTSTKETNYRIGKLESAIDAIGSDVKTKFDKVASEVKAARAEMKEYVDNAVKLAAINARIQDQQQFLEGSIQAGTIVSHLIFARNPVAAAKIDRGLGAMQTIGRSIIALGKPDLQTGAKILLSANIASGALALVGMLGGGGSESAALLQEVQAVRSDISELRQEMNDRFDRVEEMLTQMAARIDERLLKLDEKLVHVLEKLESIDVKLIELIGSNVDSFRFLIKQTYAEQFRECEKKISRVTFAAHAVQSCLKSYVSFAADVSTAAVVSSAESFNYDLDLDVSANNAKALSEEDRVGYLSVVLKVASTRGLTPDSPPVAGLVKTPVPTFWNDGVDNFAAFLNEIESFKSIRESKLTRADFLNDYRGEINSRLIPTGRVTVENIGKIRRAGVEFAIGRYRQFLNKLADVAATAVSSEVGKKDLGITSFANRKFATLTAGHSMGGFRSDGTTLYSIMFHDNDYFVVAEGPEKGREWRLKRHSWRWVDSGALMCGGCEGATEKGFTDAINTPGYFASLAPGFNTDFNYDSPAGIEQFLPEINRPYLSGTMVPNLTSNARALIPKAVETAAAAVEVRNACAALSQSRETMVLFARLMRGSFGPLDQGWLQKFEMLPGSSVDDCLAYVRGIWIDMPESGKDFNLEKHIKTQLAGVAGGIADAFLAAFRVGEHETHIDSIEARLRGLEKLAASRISRR